MGQRPVNSSFLGWRARAGGPLNISADRLHFDQDFDHQNSLPGQRESDQAPSAELTLVLASGIASRNDLIDRFSMAESAEFTPGRTPRPEGVSFRVSEIIFLWGTRPMSRRNGAAAGPWPCCRIRKVTLTLTMPARTIASGVQSRLRLENFSCLVICASISPQIPYFGDTCNTKLPIKWLRALTHSFTPLAYQLASALTPYHKTVKEELRFHLTSSFSGICLDFQEMVQILWLLPFLPCQ
jgi:hypothetical protein